MTYLLKRTDSDETFLEFEARGDADAIDSLSESDYVACQDDLLKLVVIEDSTERVVRV